MMSKQQSPRSSSDEDEIDDSAPFYEDQTPAESKQSSAASVPFEDSSSHVPAVPIQKRRRVTRACDECRRKKIKCDGKRPCNHCTIYTYECTYYQPSNRRRNPAPQYIEALEVKLQRAENVLRNFMPGVNLEDPSLDLGMPPGFPHYIKQEIPPDASRNAKSWGEQAKPQQLSDGEKDSMLESMVENTGLLDLDDDGYWDFHGHSSGRAFLRKMREQFGDLMGKPDAHGLPFLSSRPGSHPTNSPASSMHSPVASRLPKSHDLPTKQCARMLCECALDDALAILRFIHQPTFYAMFDRVYDAPSEDLGSEELGFLPLLYSTIALGSLFARTEGSQLMTNGFENAIEQGSHWFRTSRSMMDVTDCRNLVSLQTVLCMIVFLQSSAKLSTCYSHLGVCLRSSIRLGLHRAISHTFNPVEQETRKRIFWCIRKMDSYVSALLGLPQMLNADDVDQDEPLELDDQYITVDGILPMPAGQPSLMAGFNAHTRMVAILTKIVQYIYPIKGIKASKNHSYVVSHAKVREVEQDLQAWMESLPEAFQPGIEAPQECVRIQHLLRMAYAHIEMFLYRPFLHYVSQDVQARSFDKRSYACAAACVSVSRNIVHLTGEMKRRGLLVGSYWFYMYTTFFAIISLVFYVLENPHSSSSADILRDAHEGKDTLAGLAARSLAADRCSKHLAELFEQLPERLSGARMNIPSQKKRQHLTQPTMIQSAPDLTAVTATTTDRPPQRAKTAPGQQAHWQGNPLSFASSNPAMDAPYRGDLQGPFSPMSGGSVPPQSPGSAMYHNTPTGHGIPDLSAMMFPSADPFAYPNQPMTTLENRNYIKQEPPPISQAVFDPPTTAGYKGMGGQLLNQIPDYPMISPSGQEGGFSIPPPISAHMSATDVGPNAMALSQGGPEWEVQQQAQRGSQGTPLDQLYGEDWGGWMNQGYRQ